MVKKTNNYASAGWLIYQLKKIFICSKKQIKESLFQYREIEKFMRERFNSHEFYFVVTEYCNYDDETGEEYCNVDVRFYVYFHAGNEASISCYGKGSVYLNR